MKPLYLGADMVVWNEVAHTQRIIAGYPLGPVNLPMWGAFPRAHPRRSRSGAFCSLKTTRCRHAWINVTRRLYWFGHKLPMSWVHLQLASPCATAAPLTCARGHRRARKR